MASVCLEHGLLSIAPLAHVANNWGWSFHSNYKDLTGSIILDSLSLWISEGPRVQYNNKDNIVSCHTLVSIKQNSVAAITIHILKCVVQSERSTTA